VVAKIAAGEAKLAIGLDCNLAAADAHVADLLLLQRDELHAVPRANVMLTANECLIPRAGWASTGRRRRDAGRRRRVRTRAAAGC
jgi:hypothetical protein